MPSAPQTKVSKGSGEGPVARKTFLVERYWPDVTREALTAAVLRGRVVGGEMGREGRLVDHLRTTLVPADEAVFSLFEADSAEDVAELNRRADFPFDRIAQAVPIDPEEVPA